jgi:hypothetical protein
MMRTLFCIVLLLAFVMGLCACTNVELKDGIMLQATHKAPNAETSGETTSTNDTTNEAETEWAPTEQTSPPHSQLYLPDYTALQIWQYFQEVVLDMEYTDGTGDVTLVQKWMSPIRYRIYGTPTEEDYAVLTDLFAQLNAVPGFPGIYAAAEEESENLTLSFLQPDDFRNQFSDVIHGEEAYGAAQFWYYTATNELYMARVGYRTDVDQNTRNSILIEEIINALGITDTVLREDSIVYQHSDENTGLSDVDWVILQLLYDPAIQCGMGAETCAEVVQDLYY